MVKRIFFILLSIMPFCVTAQDELLSAYVDRTEVSVNDVFTLTLRVNAELRDERPDVDALLLDFEIIASSERTNFTFINGVSQQWSEFRISLRPRSTGVLTIPAFRIGNEVTMPIEIIVSDAIQNTGNNDDFFLSSIISKDEVYVQEQLLYTVKIYFSVPFDQGAQLGAPNAENAVIQQLGNDLSSQEVIDGLRYNVIERRFVIFPQSSGTMEISPISFTATVGRRRSGSIFSGQMTGGRAISLMSEPHMITVKSKPDSFPQDATWLPSSNLAVEENWSRSLQGLEPGEAITRNVRIRAEGLNSSLLPEIQYEETDTLKFYPDQPAREDLANQNGVTGIRSQGTAIVASEGGEFILPALEIPWWNTTADNLEFARLDEQILSVIPGSAEPPPSAPTLPDEDTIDQPAKDEAPTSEVESNTSYWMLATMAFALAWLYSSIMWYRSNLSLKQFASGILASGISLKKPVTSENIEPIPATADEMLQQFIQSCEQKNVSQARQRLLIWARIFFSDDKIITLATLKKYIDDADLEAQLDDLENTLYSSSSAGNQVQLENLKKTIRKLHKKGYSQKNKTAEHYALPPLYKN